MVTVSSTDMFIPLRVVDRSLLWDGRGDYTHWSGSNVFTGYMRWLLHSPLPQQQEVISPLREEHGGGMELKHWSVQIYPSICVLPLHNNYNTSLVLSIKTCLNDKHPSA